MWHNFVLCVAALAVLFLLPIFLFPMYSTGAGALVTEVVQVSVADQLFVHLLLILLLLMIFGAPYLKDKAQKTNDVLCVYLKPDMSSSSVPRTTKKLSVGHVVIIFNMLLHHKEFWECQCI